MFRYPVRDTVQPKKMKKGKKTGASGAGAAAQPKKAAAKTTTAMDVVTMEAGARRDQNVFAIPAAMRRGLWVFV